MLILSCSNPVGVPCIPRQTTITTKIPDSSPMATTTAKGGAYQAVPVAIQFKYLKTSDTVTAGDANASVTLTFSYQ